MNARTMRSPTAMTRAETSRTETAAAIVVVEMEVVIAVVVEVAVTTVMLVAVDIAPVRAIVADPVLSWWLVSYVYAAVMVTGLDVYASGMNVTEQDPDAVTAQLSGYGPAELELNDPWIELDQMKRPV